jgi:integrase
MYEKCDLCSSHVGRRSFATNNYGGPIPTSFLKYITGHSTEAMFLTYIGKSNKDIAMELTKYF